MSYASLAFPLLAGTVALTSLSPFAARAAAPGAPRSIELTWSAPSECPSQEDVETEVARLVGGVPVQQRDGSLAARASVVGGKAGGWVLTLRTELQGEQGQKVLEGRSCWEVAHAAALVLALTLNPDAPLRAQRERDSEAKPSRGTSDRWRSPQERSPMIWRVEGQSLLGIGNLPGPSLALGGAVGLEWRRLGVAAFSHYWFERSTEAEGTTDKGGDFRAIDAGAMAEVGLIMSPVLVQALLGLEVDSLRGSGWGVDVQSHASATWVAPIIGARLGLPIAQHFYVALSCYAAFPSSRRRFVLDEIGPVFRPAWIGGRFGFSVGWRS